MVRPHPLRSPDAHPRTEFAGALEQAILDALAAAGKDVNRLVPADLDRGVIAPVEMICEAAS